MAKLNQILAIEKGAKDRAQGNLTKAYQQLQKGELLSGISRTYERLDEDGEQFPPEKQLVQLRAETITKSVFGELTELFDITATKDFANTEARSDVVLDDGTKLLEGVPATYLLWLEKRLVDLSTFIGKLPVLPSDEEWEFDEQQNCYRSKTRQTAKTKKIPKPFVKYEATKEHPAQVEVVHEDRVQGYWTNVKFSGAMPAKQIADMRDRVEKLQRAVKFAREQANLTEVKPQKIGEKVFSYLLG